MQLIIEGWYGSMPYFTAIEEIKPSPEPNDFCVEVGI